MRKLPRPKHNRTSAGVPYSTLEYRLDRSLGLGSEVLLLLASNWRINKHKAIGRMAAGKHKAGSTGKQHRSGPSSYMRETLTQPPKPRRERTVQLLCLMPTLCYGMYSTLPLPSRLPRRSLVIRTGCLFDKHEQSSRLQLSVDSGPLKPLPPYAARPPAGGGGLGRIACSRNGSLRERAAIVGTEGRQKEREVFMAE